MVAVVSQVVALRQFRSPRFVCGFARRLCYVVRVFGRVFVRVFLTVMNGDHFAVNRLTMKGKAMAVNCARRYVRAGRFYRHPVITFSAYHDLRLRMVKVRFFGKYIREGLVPKFHLVGDVRIKPAP